MSSANHDTKANFRARGVMSFILFGLIFLLSVAICVNTTAINGDYIEKKFTSFEYVSGFNENITAYADDICTVNGISSDGIDDLLSYDLCYQLVDEYIGSALGNDKGYIDTTAQNSIHELEKSIVDEVKIAVGSTSYKYDEKATEKIADEICTYISNQLEVKHMGVLKTLTSVGSIASSVAVGVICVFVAVCCLITYFIGVKRYRSIRSIASAFLSAGWLDIMIAIMLLIISKIKTVDIFPLYLQNTFMSYFKGCCMWYRNDSCFVHIGNGYMAAEEKVKIKGGAMNGK